MILIEHWYLTIAISILYASSIFYFHIARNNDSDDIEKENRVLLAAKLIIAGVASVIASLIKLVTTGVLSIILIFLITIISFICIYKVKELLIWEE